jgi:hypothetical protein
MVEVDMSQGDWEFGCMIMQECPDGNVDLHALFPILITLFRDARSDKLYQKASSDGCEWQTVFSSPNFSSTIQPNTRKSVDQLLFNIASCSMMQHKISFS